MQRDDMLEAAIDAVGRERVFALAEINGWSHLDSPPKWVWWNLVREIQALNAAPPPTPSAPK